MSRLTTCERCKGLRFLELTQRDGFRPVSAGDTPEAWQRGSRVYRCGICRGEGVVDPVLARRASTVIFFGKTGVRI